MNTPTKLFAVCALLGHYDQNNKLIDSIPHLVLVTSFSEEEAVAMVRQDFFYAKQYFELMSLVVKEVKEEELSKLGYYKVYEYRHLSNNDPYSVIQEDVFRKGKENWTLDAFAPVIKVKSNE